MRNIIFHIPYPLHPDNLSGSKLRPSMMIRAFNNIGYNVDIVSGYGKERKTKISRIKSNIHKGKKYEFLYSESSTMPILLTEKHHLPTYPFLDFNFFKFCRRHNIKIGLFYRDIYWRFKFYKESVGFLIKAYASLFYYYDLIQYNKTISQLFIPSVSMKQYIPGQYTGKIKSLPPGITSMPQVADEITSRQSLTNIFYVGGISSSVYNFEILPKVVNKLSNVSLIICCRLKEWEQNKDNYMRNISSKVKVIHKSGEELIPYFNDADIFSMLFASHEYRNFAMPIKLFEYLSYRKPVIANKNSAAGNFIEKHNIGWAIDYNENELLNLLQKIVDNPDLINEKINNINKIYNSNTWEARARKVAKTLS